MSNVTVAKINMLVRVHAECVYKRDPEIVPGSSFQTSYPVGLFLICVVQLKAYMVQESYTCLCMSIAVNCA